MSTISHWKRQFKLAIARSATVQALLSPEHVERRCREASHSWRRSFWSPSTTLLAFLLQALNGAKTLRAAVADLLGDMVLSGAASDAPSVDPSAFAQARQRLPEAVVAATLREATRRIVDIAGTERLWLGRRVMLIDGSSVSMPDEPELQEAFPQPVGQKKGCGFPVARLLALFCWGTGALLEVAMGSQHDSEVAMLRKLHERFDPGDVALADRGFCSYVDIARFSARGVDVVFRLNQRRPSDFRQGRRLGPDDRLITWQRPAKWPPRCGLTLEQFEALPEEMMLRMVRLKGAPRGFRSRTIVVVTTILDPEKASTDQLLALYRDRWMVELNLRSMKTTLKMDVLRGRSLDVVRKELLVHALLYNLIRLLMWEAAREGGRNPRRMSFAGTLHRLQRLGPTLLRGSAPRDIGVADVLAAMFAWIAADLLPERPGRVEPRRVKRRPKNYTWLTKPRARYHAASR